MMEGGSNEGKWSVGRESGIERGGIEDAVKAACVRLRNLLEGLPVGSVVVLDNVYIPFPSPSTPATAKKFMQSFSLKGLSSPSPAPASHEHYDTSFSLFLRHLITTINPMADKLNLVLVSNKPVPSKMPLTFLSTLL